MMLLPLIATAAINFAEIASVSIGTNEVQTVAVGGETVWRKLPYDDEILWIEANADNGTVQYIDTGCPVTTDTLIEASWRQLSTTAQQRLFGLNDGNANVFALYINSASKWAVNTGTSSGGSL